MKRCRYFFLLFLYSLSSVHAYPYLDSYWIPEGNIGEYYSHQLSAYSDTGSSVTFNSWNLPNGMYLSSSGLLYGTPEEAGDFYLYIELTDSYDWNSESLYFYVDDDIIDDDEDGMSDNWEQQIVFSSTNDSMLSIYDVTRDDNFDGDTFSNIEEYLLGFDPTIVDGNEPDSLSEGLLLIQSALSNDYDSVYVDLINECFTQALVYEPYNLRIYVYRALANIFLLLQQDEIHQLVEDFGYYLTDERVHAETDIITDHAYNFDYETAPSVDIAKGVIFSNVVALLDQSLSDLNQVPDGWNSYVEFSPVYFRSDDTYYLDEGDVIALKGLLNLFKSYFLGFYAYQVDHLPYTQWMMPMVVTNSLISVDGNITDWAGISPSLIGSQTSEIADVKCTRSQSNLYLLVNFNDHFLSSNTALTWLSFSAETDLNNIEDIYIQSDWYPGAGTNFNRHWDHDMGDWDVPQIQIATNNHYMEIDILLPTNYFNTPIMLTGLEFGNYEIGSYLDFPLEKIPYADPNFLATVDTNLMALSGAAMQDGIDLLQLADAKINARTDLLMHLIEYEPDAEFADDRADALDAVAEFETFLNGTNTWVTEGMHEFTGESLNYTNQVYLGALYQAPFVTRSLIPEFDGHLDHPRMRELPDPTFGGLLPFMTQEKFSEIMATQNRDVSSIEIIGTNVVSEGSTAAYQVMAHYLNGSSQDVTSNAFFTLNDIQYSITSNQRPALLTTPQIQSDESIILAVDYEEDQAFYVDLSILVRDLELSEALDNYGLIWSTGPTVSARGWSGQNFDSYDGEDAAKSGNISHNETSWLQADASGAGTLSFWYKVSTEANADEFRFWIDGEPKILQSGEHGWQQASYELSEDSDHVFLWEYVKDKSDVFGQDSVWVDQVVWTGESHTESFQSWLSARGITGDETLLFSQDHNSNGIPNGMEYAFGSNMTFRIQIINSEPGVEISVQNETSVPYVDIAIYGTTNLVDWTLDVSEVSGAPSGHKWYVPTNTPDNAFFKVEATLTE